MKYEKYMKLPNGKELTIRNATAQDGKEMLIVFNQAHSETDYLLTYTDENTFTAEREAAFLQEKEESQNEIELAAMIDGKIVGSAGIEAVGAKYKIEHRAEYGISIIKEYWGMGIGKRLTESCIACAKNAGYKQLELQVVAQNEAAVALYQQMGFKEYGRNPLGFKSRFAGYQEIIYMRLEL